MNYLDTRINELTNETEDHLLRSSQPLGVIGLLRRVRSGRLGRFFWATWIAQLVLFVIGVVAAVNFFGASDVLPAVKSGLLAATTLIMSLQLRVSLSPHLHTERVLRHLKRVEILILSQREK